MPYFARNASNFDDLPKMGNYTTPEEIDEMRELQQVTATGHRSAKRCRFYRVELLNGQVPDEGRSAARSTETGRK